MVHFAHVCQELASTAGKKAKIALLAEYFSTLDDADLEAAARFFTGNPFPQREQTNLALGGSTIVDAAKHLWGISDAELSASYREHGDLGAALGPFVRERSDLGLFTQALSPGSLKALFDEIAGASGRAARKRRQHLCEQILGACREPLEATYVIKIMTGDLRIGLKAGLLVESIAQAFAEPAHEVRKSVMASGDIGSVAVAARHHTLADIAVAYGVPIGFMLASPLQFGSAYRELSDGRWIVEEKYDGIRVQAHKEGESVRLFSRTLNDVSTSYPEIVAALAAMPGRYILDGELVARRNGDVLPFRYLQGRLQRKTVSDEIIADVPVAYVCFDILVRDSTYLLDESIIERKAQLTAAVQETSLISIAPWAHFESAAGPEPLHERFEAARSQGHEGLMLKNADSSYHPGRRGTWWLKLKRELSVLDVVVVAVEWGHGKRAKVLSDYTFAIRGRDGELLTIGKAYSGLTDKEIATLTPIFLEQQQGRRGHAIAVAPTVVLEVAFDIIAPSTLHESGFALRFPRIVRIRDDKPASEIDTIDRVEEIYRTMLQREGVQR